MGKEHQNNEDLNDWVDALEYQILFNGKDNAQEILSEFLSYAKNKGLFVNENAALPFENSYLNMKKSIILATGI